MERMTLSSRTRSSGGPANKICEFATLEKLSGLIKFRSAGEAATALGGAGAIRTAFVGIQRHLHEEKHRRTLAYSLAQKSFLAIFSV